MNTESNPIDNEKPPDVRQIISLPVASIEIGLGRRISSPGSIYEMAESIETKGLLSPIHVRLTAEGHHKLIAGQRRLKACDLLGHEKIECICLDVDETAARIIEIVENLEREELTALERAEQLSEVLTLTMNSPSAVHGQHDHKPQGGRPEGGLALAARTLEKMGPTEEARRKKFERAKKISGITDEGKAAAKKHKIDDNSDALFEVAKEKTAEAQVKKVQEVAGRQRKQRAPAASEGSAGPTDPLVVPKAGDRSGWTPENIEARKCLWELWEATPALVQRDVFNEISEKFKTPK